MQSLGIRLYLPDAVLAQRVDVAEMAAYIRALEKQLVATCAPLDLWEADGLMIAVGVKPGGASRVWCEAVVGKLPAGDMDRIAGDLSAVAGPAVRMGPLAFAFHIHLLEGDPPAFPAAPKVWQEAAKNVAGAIAIPDGVFELLWPDV